MYSMSCSSRNAALANASSLLNLCLNSWHSFSRNHRRSSSVRQYAKRSAKWLTSSLDKTAPPTGEKSPGTATSAARRCFPVSSFIKASISAGFLPRLRPSSIAFRTRIRSSAKASNVSSDMSAEGVSVYMDSFGWLLGRTDPPEVLLADLGAARSAAALAWSFLPPMANIATRLGPEGA